MFATYLSTVLVDRAGRRVLLLLSSGVMTICLATLGTYFHLKEHKFPMDGITWLPLLSVALFIVMFSLGLGPLPWCVVSEIFSAGVKAQASSIACAANWLMAFIVTYIFPVSVVVVGVTGSDNTFLQHRKTKPRFWGNPTQKPKAKKI